LGFGGDQEGIEPSGGFGFWDLSLQTCLTLEMQKAVSQTGGGVLLGDLLLLGSWCRPRRCLCLFTAFGSSG
jgi:hypothetical protein